VAEPIMTRRGAGRARDLRNSDDSVAGRKRVFGKAGAAIAVTGIGDLARSCGVTARALRYYESEGLISSRRTRQGERLFTPRQCEIAHLIVRLRNLNVAIVDIRDFINEGVPEPTRVMTMRRQLECQAADLSFRLSAIHQCLEGPESLTTVRWPGLGTRPVQGRRFG